MTQSFEWHLARTLTPTELGALLDRLDRAITRNRNAELYEKGLWTELNDLYFYLENEEQYLAEVRDELEGA